ncbi:hypothetical protein [Streptomyces xantholiticus]|uniref:hypothetical protein n=1 Tax=Streptomyces xantholiticus TaxID=68285 RepID=UPI00167B8BE4|nr:hypothetical protein [Streptomyces xantholiticus]GGW70203.1 hypothetical protein GCM10010381_63800 [Streptomyces xantholiticus]
MTQPNPFLPDARGIASGNNYSFMAPANSYAPSAPSAPAAFVYQAAAVVTPVAVRHVAPVITKAAKEHGPDMLRVCGRFGLELLKALSRVR